MSRPSRRSRRYGISLTLVFVLVVYSAWALLRPLAPIHPSSSSLHLDSGTISNDLAWPDTGQAAVGISPSGVLATHGTQSAAPIASTAKVLTALAVLKKHPISYGQTGPKITLTDTDVAIYSRYVSGNGSVTPVEAGETLTEYQMLQAILLPSANNIADSLAIWAFGSLDSYSNFTNGYLRQLGLTHTRVGADASGYDPSTISTAHDLVLLGEAAMQEPVLADIVGQKSADLPVAGTIHNVNGLVGSNGIVGIKTGNTDEAGGVFLGAKKVTVSGKNLIIISAVVGTSSLYDALASSLPLLASAQANLAQTTILPAGSIVGKYSIPHGANIQVVTAKELSSVIWKGSQVPTDVKLNPVSLGTPGGSIVGSVRVPQSTVSTAQTTVVVLKDGVPVPSKTWRLLHPLSSVAN